MHLFLRMQGLTNLQKEERVSSILPFFTHYCKLMVPPPSSLPKKKNSCYQPKPSTPLLKNWNGTSRLIFVQEFGLPKLVWVIWYARMIVKLWSLRDMARILLRVMGLVPMLLYKWLFKRHILGYMVCFFFFFFWWVWNWWFYFFFFFFSQKGRIECVYEPAMTKAFLHGRTEAIRSVQPQSVNFINVRWKLI